MPNFIWLFASSSQLSYEHFALFSPDSPRLSSAFSLTSTICKSFLCPTKEPTFSCQQIFFNLSSSQQTLLNPLANCSSLLADPSALPLLCLELLCLLLALLSSAYVQRTPAPPSLSKFLILLLSCPMLLWAYSCTGRFCRGIGLEYRRKIGNVWARPFSGCSGRIPTAPAQGLGPSSLTWHKVGGSRARVQWENSPQAHGLCKRNLLRNSHSWCGFWRTKLWTGTALDNNNFPPNSWQTFPCVALLAPPSFAASPIPNFLSEDGI